MTSKPNENEIDLIERSRDVEVLKIYIENLIGAGHKKHVINIDSPWGTGKSFFLNLIEEDLGNDYICIRFNAWEADYSTDPLISLCCELSHQLKQHKKIKNSLDDSILNITQTAYGIAAKELLLGSISAVAGTAASTAVRSIVDTSIEHSKENVILKEYQERKAAIKRFKDTLKFISKEATRLADHPNSNPIFILIDELDRCKPTFSIDLLESVKHLFDIDGIFFIIATDTNQLAHTIRAVYGSEFESHAYLNRFFNSRYKLSEQRRDLYLDHIIKNNTLFENFYCPNSEEASQHLARPRGDIRLFSNKILQYFNYSLRDMEQLSFKITAISPRNKDLHLLPLLYLICLHHKCPSLYTDLRATKDPDLIKIFNESIPLKNFHTYLRSTAYSTHGNREQNIPIYELMTYYFRLLTINKSNEFPAEENNYLKRDILNAVKSDYAQNRRNVDIATYFELTDNSARFSDTI